MPVTLALYQPDIPQNTGTLMRLSACMGTVLHIIHPTGFVFSNKNLKRAGMDYAAEAQILEHNSFDDFDNWRRSQNARLMLLTTKSSSSAYDMTYTENDILMLGRESAGVPNEIAAIADARIRIPMATGMRSINVALSGAMILGEALRQTNSFAPNAPPALSQPGK